MAVRARNPWVRRLLAGVAAGCGGFLAMWLITKILVASHMSLENTYLDEFLVGLLIAFLVVAIEVYHEARLRRIRQAAQLMGQLNHYIRNSLQVILYSSSMPPSEVSQEAIRASVYRIQWVLEKLVQESELFSGARTYLGKSHVEVDLASLLKKPPEPAPGYPRGTKEEGEKKQAG
jgi:hypothetical protein